MKIVHTVADLDRSSGGPPYTVTTLCRHLRPRVDQIEIHALMSDHPVIDPQLKIKLHPVIGPLKLGFSPSLKKGLGETMRDGGILHSSGLWLIPNIYPGAVVEKTGCKLVISTRGMLSPWALSRSRIKKRLVGLLWQNAVLYKANCLHATAECELSDIRSYGLRAPVSLIPNGVEIPEEALLCGRPADPKTILYFGRIHPYKKIDQLIKAWGLIAADFPQWRLVICGPGEDAHVRDLIRQIDASNGSVTYRAPIYDNKKKAELFLESSLLVLPSQSENFGVVIAEALAHGVPVIASKGTPWDGLATHGCGWWVDNETGRLRDVLSHALRLAPGERREMGERGRKWMQASYSWESIADNMYATYEWLLGTGRKPGCIYLD